MNTEPRNPATDQEKIDHDLTTTGQTVVQKPEWKRPLNIQVGKPGEFKKPGVRLADGTVYQFDDVSQLARSAEEFARMPPEVQKMLDENPAMASVWFDQSLSKHQRKLKLMPFISKMRKDKHQLEHELKDKEKEFEVLQGLIESFKKYQDWLQQPQVLEKNDCSRLHMLVQAMQDGHLINSELQADETNAEVKGVQRLKADLESPLADFQPFVVQHDWARAFEGATDYAEGDEIKLPFEQCVFEFRMSGRSIIVAAEQDEVIELLIFVQIGDWWVHNTKIMLMGETGVAPFVKLARDQIKAISVAIDAQVAEHAVVRAPEKLNRARAKQGRLPLYDYHIASLSSRSRISNPSSEGTGRRKRLHFRRGHWRHYSTFKTWVRWTLVGDLELGFVDKEYRL